MRHTLSICLAAASFLVAPVCAREFSPDDFNLLTPTAQVQEIIKDVEEVQLKLKALSNKLKNVQGVVQVRRDGERLKAADGGPDWKWDAKNRVWRRIVPRAQTSAFFGSCSGGGCSSCR